MHTRAVQVIGLIFSLVLSVVILIAASKYAAWSHGMVSTATGTWLPLVFYVGTIPFFSLVYIVAHLAGLQFKALPSAPYPQLRRPPSMRPNAQPYDPKYTASITLFILCMSILYSLAWLGQSILCTSCELAPILRGNQGVVPKWCPQSHFRDDGNPSLPAMLGTLATVKDILQWIMVALSLILIECSRREYTRASLLAHQTTKLLGTGVDFGGPSQGTDTNFALKRSMTAISGPKLIYRAEEEARQRAEAETRRIEEEKRKKNAGLIPHFATTQAKGLPQPVAPAAPGNKDNYYGNGMLKRSNTTHMYESRIAVPQAAQVSDSTTMMTVQLDQSASIPVRPAPAPQQPVSGAKDNSYGNGMGVQRSGTVNMSYESRLAGIVEEDEAVPRPLNVRKGPPAGRTGGGGGGGQSAARGKSDNTYGNGMSMLQRSGTLLYESRI